MLESRRTFIFWILAFRASLDIAYLKFMSPEYTDSFLSFPLKFEYHQYAFSWLLSLLTIPFLREKLEKLSDYFFVLYALTLIVPMCSLFGMDEARTLEPLLAIWAPFIIMVTIVRWRFIKSIHIPHFSNSRNAILTFSWISILYFIGWSILSGAVFHLNFDPTKVYEFRAENSELIDQGILAYINIWVYKFFSIFLIATALVRKNYFTVLLLLIFQFYVYAVTAHKIVLFLPLLTIGVWYFFERSKALSVIPITYTLIVLAGLLMYLALDTTYVSSMMIRRPFFVGTGLTYEWIAFFQGHPHTFWSDTLMKHFIDYPYDVALPYVVGTSLLGPELAANNGMVSTGFAHAGYAGVLLYAVILGYFVKILDNVTSHGAPLWFGLALTVGPLRTAINDSDLLTAAVSHGLLIALIILVMYRAPQKNNTIHPERPRS